MNTTEPTVRRRFDGRRYGLVRGTWMVFQDAPLAAGARALMTLAAGAAIGPLLMLATERFVATALDVAGGKLPLAAIAAPVIALAALFAVQIVESVVRALADARIEAGLRRGFRADLTGKRARLEYHYIESAQTWDLLRRAATTSWSGGCRDDGAAPSTCPRRCCRGGRPLRSGGCSPSGTT